MNILIVEDEIKIRDVLIAYFLKENWNVVATGNGNEVVSKFLEQKSDLIVLDLMIDGLSGEEVCRRIREISNVPLIMVTSKSREQDAINGLNIGADHYITKPFRVKELVAQIHALLRRVNAHTLIDTKSVIRSYNNRSLIINLENQEVIVRGKAVNLTTTEIRVLTEFIDHPGKFLSRNDLSFAVLGYRFIGDGRAIDAHISNIRKKIEHDPKNPIYIVTKVGFGYKFGFQTDEEKR